MSEQKKKRLPKTHKDYWKQRVEKLSYKDADGQKIESGEYSIRLSHQGKREYFPLNTSNLATAATKAKKIYTYISANGMDAALAEFKPKEEVPDVSTVGELIGRAKELSKAKPRTLSNYARSLRQIAGDIKRIKAGKDRFRPGGGDWQQKVDKVKLSAITPDEIAKWRKKQKQGMNPDEAAQKDRSVDATFSQVRSIWKHCTLPDPFKDEKWKTGTPKFKTTIGAQNLLYFAMNELKDKQPEQFKAFVLVLFLGLRKSEADPLTWEQIDFEKAQVEIKTTKYFALKNDTTKREIPMSESTLKMISSWRADADKVFILHGGDARPSSTYAHYRAKNTWDDLSAWLQSKGVEADRPIQYLRKLSGSLIYKSLDIYAAKNFLGHTDIRTTISHYVEAETGALDITPEKPEPKAVGN